MGVGSRGFLKGTSSKGFLNFSERVLISTVLA